MEEPKIRRTLKDIERFVSPQDILSLIEKGRVFPYKTDPYFYHARDKALTSFIYLMGCRVNEALKVKRNQLDLKTDPDFIIVKDFKISKRKKQTIKRIGIPKIDMGLPRKGIFSPFTNKLIKWLKVSPYVPILLFPNINRKSAWRIIEHQTGKWPHWFRSQRISWLINALKSETIVAKILGIRNPGTISHYYKGEWGKWKDILGK